MQSPDFESWSHPRRRAWRDAFSAPNPGQKRRYGRKHNARRCGNCYGVCCGEYTGRKSFCTVCRKLSDSHICCGHWTVKASPRIRFPRLASEQRWKEFLSRFPRFRYRADLKVPDDAPRPNSISKHDTTFAPNSKKKWKRSTRQASAQRAEQR